MTFAAVPRPKDERTRSVQAKPTSSTRCSGSFRAKPKPGVKISKGSGKDAIQNARKAPLSPERWLLQVCHRPHCGLTAGRSDTSHGSALPALAHKPPRWTQRPPRSHPDADHGLPKPPRPTPPWFPANSRPRSTQLRVDRPARRHPDPARLTELAWTPREPADEPMSRQPPGKTSEDIHVHTWPSPASAATGPSERRS